MKRFTVQGNEYDLKLTFASTKYLNSLHDGGALQLVAKVMTGDVVTFANVIHAALFHAGKNFALKTIEKEIEMLIDGEELELTEIIKTGKELLEESFFYKKAVNNMMKDEKTRAQLEMLLSE